MRGDVEIDAPPEGLRINDGTVLDGSLDPMPGVEIERKWLVEDVPAGALAAPSERIEQGYLTIGSDGAETRVRRRGERCFLTVKSGTGHGARRT